MIACACAATGILSALRLRDDERRWRAWVTLLQRLYGELRYTAMPLQAIFAAVNTDDLQALPWLSEFAKDDAALRCPSALSKEEQPFAEGFFAGLGITDLEGQLRHVEWYIQRAEEEVEKAKDTFYARAKAYTTTGICSGLCIGLLLW